MSKDKFDSIRKHIFDEYNELYWCARERVIRV